MPKRITGVFETRDAGQQAAQSLVQQGIDSQRLFLLAGAPVAAAPVVRNARRVMDPAM